MRLVGSIAVADLRGGPRGHVPPPGTDINDIHLLLCCFAVVLNQPLCKLVVSTPKASGFNTNSLNSTG